MGKILAGLEIESVIVVHKERFTYLVQDFEISLDNVKELGYFVEIKAMQDFGGVKKTNQALQEFAKSLKLDLSNTINAGYPFLLLKKKQLIQE